MTDEESTRARLREIVHQFPNVTGAQLARELGVSRQRVSQLLKAEGIALVPWTLDEHRAAAKARGPKARVQTGGVTVPVSGTTAGQVAELLAAADLAARGFAVFLPIVRTESCDLVILHRTTGTVERVEVRSGSRRGGRIVWRKADARRKNHKSDRRAIVVTGEPVHYSPPFPGDTADEDLRRLLAARAERRRNIV